jgi:hypothetical protein
MTNLTCPTCRASNPVGRRSCWGCGRALGPGAPAATLIIDPGPEGYTVVELAREKGHGPRESLAATAATLAADVAVTLVERRLIGRSAAEAATWLPIRRTVVGALSGAALVLFGLR